MPPPLPACRRSRAGHRLPARARAPVSSGRGRRPRVAALGLRQRRSPGRRSAEAFDPLRDEAEEYARRLAAAGTPVTLRRFPGFIHAFIAAIGVSRTSRDALVEIAGATRAMFAAT